MSESVGILAAQVSRLWRITVFGIISILRGITKRESSIKGEPPRRVKTMTTKTVMTAMKTTKTVMTTIKWTASTMARGGDGIGATKEVCQLETRVFSMGGSSQDQRYPQPNLDFYYSTVLHSSTAIIKTKFLFV